MKPDWKEAAIYSVKPVLLLEPRLHLHADRHGGHHDRAVDAVLPAGGGGGEGHYGEGVCRVADRGDRRLRHDLGDRVLHHRGLRRRDLRPTARGISRTRRKRRSGCKPFGQYAFLLFSAGLFNASIFAACILPLSTAYSVCEGLGFESGVNKRLREAPIFYFLYTLLIVVGAGVVLLPKFPLVKMILLSQVLNGVLLPFVLIFMILLINKKDLMGEWTNSSWFNVVSWITVVLIIGLTLAYVGISMRGRLVHWGQ